MLRTLFDEIGITSVVDVGCGVAPWLRTAMDLGATRGLGMDGDYVDRSRLLVEPALFRQCNLETENLRAAVSGDQMFDLVICMEVAEHLSSARAESFIAELCSLSNLIIFSAAIPGQGGVNHVNEQWPEYWAERFATCNFACFDVLRQPLWNRNDCEWWYLQNVLVFARKDSDAAASVARLGSATPAPMRLVHPRKLIQTVEQLQGEIAELAEMTRYQPFGRDEGIRALEAKVDLLRAVALAREAELESLHNSTDGQSVQAPSREISATRESNSSVPIGVHRDDSGRSISGK
jgi:hypothetical protein